METSLSFLGTGWAFPPQFSRGGKDLQTSTGIDDIQQSLEILLGTRLGERIMQEDYGSSLEDFMFEEVSSAVINNIESMIKEAIIYHESRIMVNDISIDWQPQNNPVLLINIDFDIPASNSRFNMVYPFYIREANT